jgi:hypothetical protein
MEEFDFAVDWSGLTECVNVLDQDGPAGSWQPGTELSAKTGAAPGSDGAMPPGSGSIRAKKRGRKAADTYRDAAMKGRP